MRFKFIIITFLVLISSVAFSQTSTIKIDPEKEKIFSPYLYHRHGGPEGLAEFKIKDPEQYAKEMWYYTESFYMKRKHFTEGVALNEGGIDISRFESQRKYNEETLVALPGYSDVLVLLPENKLIYKPGTK